MAFRQVRAWFHQSAKWATLERLDSWIMQGVLERALIARLSQQPRPSSAPVHTLYVDISVIEQDDAGTGIQRVVRSIRSRMADVVANGVNIVPVVIPRRREGYRTVDGAQIQGGPGTVFFGLDFATDAIYRYRDELAAFRREGGKIWFLLHDTLPLSHRQWFTPANQLRYRRWIRVCAALAACRGWSAGLGRGFAVGWAPARAAAPLPSVHAPSSNPQPS